jgi:hypothetical protein
MVAINSYPATPSAPLKISLFTPATSLLNWIYLFESGEFGGGSYYYYSWFPNSLSLTDSNIETNGEIPSLGKELEDLSIENTHDEEKTKGTGPIWRGSLLSRCSFRKAKPRFCHKEEEDWIGGSDFSPFSCLSCWEEREVNPRFRLLSLIHSISVIVWCTKPSQGLCLPSPHNAFIRKPNSSLDELRFEF